MNYVIGTNGVVSVEKYGVVEMEVDTERFSLMCHVRDEDNSYVVEHESFKKLVGNIIANITNEQLEDLKEQREWFIKDSLEGVKAYGDKGALVELINSYDKLSIEDTSEISFLISNFINVLECEYNKSIVINNDCSIIDMLDESTRKLIDNYKGDNETKEEFKTRQLSYGYTPERMNEYIKYMLMRYADKHCVVSELIKKDSILEEMMDAATLLLDVKMGNSKLDDYSKNVIMLIIDVTFDII